MLNFSKRVSIVDLVHQSQNNCKKLFKLINNLLGKRNSSLMPRARTMAQPSEEFTTYFLNKIELETDLRILHHINLDN